MSERLLQRWSAFSTRERVLVVATLLVTTIMAWLSFAFDSQEARIAATRRAISSLDSQLRAEAQAQAALLAAQDPDRSGNLVTDRKLLEARLREVRRSVDRDLTRFVEPAAMAAVLEDLMTRYAALELKRLTSLPVQPMTVVEDGETVPVEGLYRHRMRLEFEGSYFDTLAYLQALERSPWQFGWERLDYEVVAHPRARIVVEVETLGRDRNLIGV